jgi:ADP-ribose pyrophosphatase
VQDPDKILLKSDKFCVVRREEKRTSGQVVFREIILHPGAVAIVAMVDADRVCLITNRRLAVGETLIELPAGTLEAGEDPEHAAVRELAEETGYRAEKMTPLHECFMSPGILRERMHIFLATQLTAGETALEADEQIQTFIVDWKQALRMIEDRRIRDAKSIAGLLLYDRMRSG